MSEIVISEFPGIAPRLRNAAPRGSTYAKRAINVDLYGKTIRPFKGNEFVEGGHTGPEFFYFGKFPDGTFFSGKTNYFSWTLDGFDILFFKDTDNKFKKRIGGSVDLVGIARPTVPELEDISIDTPSLTGVSITYTDSNVAGEFLARAQYVYYITFSQYPNGKELEGKPSLALQADPYPEDIADEQLANILAWAPETVYTAGTHVKFLGLGVPVAIYQANSNHTSGSTTFQDDVAAGKWDFVTYSQAVNNRFHTINRPVITDASITNWNLYRSDDGDTPKLIYQGGSSGLGEGFDIITDKKNTHARGRELGSIIAEGEQFRFQYLMTWVREQAGFRDESGPSEPVAIRLDLPGVRVFRPATYPANVIYWRIYRVSTSFDATTEFQLVQEVPIASSFYDDNELNEDVGDAITTSFTSEDGLTVNYGPLPDGVEGMFGPHYGMLFAWKGSDLYYTEPGKPDGWPDFNRQIAEGHIVGCADNGGELLVFTTAGVQRLIGTSPEKFFLAKAFTDDGATSRRAMVSFRGGTVYLSDSGLILVSGANATNVTDEKIGEEYFRDINKESVFLAFNDGIVYMFHDAGVLLWDTRIDEFSELDNIYLDAMRINETGFMYVLTQSGTIIQQLHGSSDDLTVTYRSGEVVLSSPARKRFRRLEFTGTGSYEAEIFLDGASVTTHTLNMGALLRDRQIETPHGARARSLQFEIVGEGEVREVRVEVFRAP